MSLFLKAGKTSIGRNLFALVFSFVFASATNAQNPDVDSLPDWFFNPSPEGTVGFVGAAFQSAGQAEQTAEFARYYAVRELIDTFPGEIETNLLFDLITRRKSELPFRQGRLSFSTNYARDGIVLERLLYEKSPSASVADASREATRKQCDFSRCRPGWLCSPVQGETVGMLGVSYRASSFRRQLELTRKNAVEMLEYTYGVRVEGKQRLFQSGNSAFRVRLSNESFSVSKNFKNPEIVLYAKAQCFMDETLISWIVGDELPTYFTAKNLEWLENPSHGNVSGSIGGASGEFQVLFSRQMEIAFENALNELSKNKEVDLQTDTIVKVESGNGVSDKTRIRLEHDNLLKPRMMGIFLDDDKYLRIWVADSVDIPPPNVEEG